MERDSGFTLIELLVTLAVIALILSVGVPSYQGIVARSVITSTGNDLLSAVSLAGSEALRRDGAVTLQAAAPQAGNALGEGYCIVVDNPGNCSGALIKRVAPAPGELSIDIVGATALTFDGLGRTRSPQSRSTRSSSSARRPVKNRNRWLKLESASCRRR